MSCSHGASAGRPKSRKRTADGAGRAAFALAALASVLGPALGARAAEPTRWLGHQVTLGHRELPVIGPVDTRTDTWVLAEVTRTATSVELVQRACRVRVAEVAGTAVELADEGVRRLPPTRVRFRPNAAEGWWYAGPWTSGWDHADQDGDRRPGLAISVRAPLCGGTLHVASEAKSWARARSAGGALSGELKVELTQTILEVDGACLSVVSSDSHERLRGRFAYRAVEADATCASLERSGALDRPLAEARP